MDKIARDREFESYYEEAECAERGDHVSRGVVTDRVENHAPGFFGWTRESAALLKLAALPPQALRLDLVCVGTKDVVPSLAAVQ